MIDLIKNLRFIATREAKEGEYPVTENIDWMAADEIERLNGLVALQKKDMKVAMDNNERLRAALQNVSKGSGANGYVKRIAEEALAAVETNDE